MYNIFLSITLEIKMRGMAHKIRFKMSKGNNDPFTY